MNKTKRLFSAVVLVAVFAVACLALVACKVDSVNNYFVTYDGQKLTVSGKKGETVKFPEVTREGYLFDGWYTSENFDGTAVDSAVASGAFQTRKFRGSESCCGQSQRKAYRGVEFGVLQPRCRAPFGGLFDRRCLCQRRSVQTRCQQHVHYHTL